jgi:uncharacterized protein HemY
MFPQAKDIKVARALLANAEGDSAGMMNFARQAIEEGSADPALYLMLGRHYFDRDAFQDAYQIFNAAYERGVAVPPLYFYLAISMMKLDNWSGAAGVLRRMEFEGMYHPGMFFQLGYACLRLKDEAAAIKYYQKSLRTDPDMEEAHYHLGLLYQQKRRYREAYQAFVKALEREPDNELYKESLNEILAQLGKGTS